MRLNSSIQNRISCPFISMDLKGDDVCDIQRMLSVFLVRVLPNPHADDATYVKYEQKALLHKFSDTVLGICNDLDVKVSINE